MRNHAASGTRSGAATRPAVAVMLATALAFPQSMRSTAAPLSVPVGPTPVIAVAHAGAGAATKAVQPPAEDPPELVGRLAFLEGQVSYRPGSDQDWTPATPNRPVVSGDALWADADGRGEVDAGFADLRFANQAEVDVVRLDYDGLQVRLPQGSLIERVRTYSDNQDEVDAPNAAIIPGQIGEYRVDVSPDGSVTTVTVFTGNVQVTAAGSSFQVDAQQTATVNGTDNPTFNLTDASPVDDFDNWSVARDAREGRATDARRYVADGVPGADDLDEYGGWSNDPQYGAVWYPNGVAAGWAPYHDGHWVWVSPWGWTWVDNAPWGWAPFHYGRWAYVGNRWGWCPGRVVTERPVYAPALVVFVGGGPGSPGGNVGWFPLGPQEVYRPAYPTSVTYVRQMNVTNVTNVTNITNVTNVTNVTYRNREAPGALTVVPERTLVNAEPVGHAAIAPPKDFARSGGLAMAPAVVPTRASLAYHPQGGRAAVSPPTALGSRPVIALHSPPPAPVSFAAQQSALAASHGRPLGVSQLATIRQSAPTRTPIAPIKAAGPARPVTLTRGAPPTPAAKLLSSSKGPAVGSRVTPPSTSRPVGTTESQPARSVQTPPKTAASSNQATVDRQYQTERNAMETRHQAEFAHPPAGETQQSLAARQESEHRELDTRYQAAKVQGLKTLPPKPAPRPAPKPAKENKKQ